MLVRFDSQQMSHHAAALTYYAMLSLFPSILLASSFLALVGGEGTSERAVQYLERNGAAQEVVDPVEGLLSTAVATSAPTAGIAFALAILLALIGASGWVAASRRALNVVWAADENRPVLRRKLRDLGATVVLVVLVAGLLIALFLGGDVARDLFGTLGLGDQAAGVWLVARWVVAVALAFLFYALVYAEAPDVAPDRMRLVSPGTLIAVPLWLGVSYAFFYYVSNLADLRLFGAFAAAVVLLIWLWLSNAALLLGAQLNAVATFDRRMGRGGPPFPVGAPDPGSPEPGVSTGRPAPGS